MKTLQFDHMLGDFAFNQKALRTLYPSDCSRIYSWIYSWRSWVRVPLWPLAGFVLGRPEFKFSATLVNSQLVVSCQLGFLILLCCI